jgi:surface carbohydrate biosynthesis protein
LKKVREVDIVYLYEHAARELDVACAIAAVLRQRGLSVEILQWPTSFFAAVGKFRPKIVVLPFCYTERSFLPLLQYWAEAIFFNMTWEQLFYGGNQLAKTPRGEFSTQHVIHHSWSQPYSELLRAQGIPEEHIFTNGHPAYAFYDAPYRHNFMSRENLARRHGLDISKKWIFFPENYNWAFYTQASIERFIEAGQSPEDIEVMKQFCNMSLVKVLRWCSDVTERGDVELIVRPRPATHLDDFKAFADRVLDSYPPNLHFLQDESVRDWILAANLVVSSHSTSLIEAAVAGKPAIMLAPYSIPTVLHVEWHDLVPRIATREDFLDICHRQESGDVDHRLADWAKDTLMSHGDSIMNLADKLEDLSTGKIARPPSVNARKYTTPAKQIIPEWLWLKYHQRKGGKTPTPEEYKKDIVDPGEMEARISKWQIIMADFLKAGS